MNTIRILAVALLAGCASLSRADAPGAEEQLALGLQALERQDFPAAYTHLNWIATRHWQEEIGRRALLAMAAVELDPRNGGRRLDVAAELAGRHLQLAEIDPLSVPVSQTLYLLAFELGAAEERAAHAEAQRAAAEAGKAAAQAEAARAEQESREAEADARRAETRARRAESAAARARAQSARATRELPRLSGPSVSAQLGELRDERSRLREQVASLRERLAEREAELERIRETLADEAARP